MGPSKGFSWSCQHNCWEKYVSLLSDWKGWHSSFPLWTYQENTKTHFSLSLFEHVERSRQPQLWMPSWMWRDQVRKSCKCWHYSTFSIPDPSNHVFDSRWIGAASRVRDVSSTCRRDFQQFAARWTRRGTAEHFLNHWRLVPLFEQWYIIHMYI